MIVKPHGAETNSRKDQRQIVAPGEIRKMPRLSRSHRGGMEYERVEQLSPIIKEMAAAGLSRERIARLVINQNTGKPISVETLKKYYARELEIGLDEANLALRRRSMKPGFARFESRWSMRLAGGVASLIVRIIGRSLDTAPAG